MKVQEQGHEQELDQEEKQEKKQEQKQEQEVVQRQELDKNWAEKQKLEKVH